jgi:hypothetical protein
MRLLLQEGKLGQRTSLNLKTIEKVKTGLTGIAVALCVVAALTRQSRWLFGVLVCLALVIAMSASVYRFYHRTRGLWFTLRIIPLHLCYYFLNGLAAGTGWLMHHLVGAPAPTPEVQAFAEVGLQTWPPLPRKAQGSAWGR